VAKAISARSTPKSGYCGYTLGASPTPVNQLIVISFGGRANKTDACNLFVSVPTNKKVVCLVMGRKLVRTK